MAVTTRNYNISMATPIQAIDALETAFKDLGWLESNPLGYLTGFTNTPGSANLDAPNGRYLVTQESTTGNGSGAVFDVFRLPNGAISTVTLVTGGNNYSIVGRYSTSTGNVLAVGDSTGIFPGMVVTKITGTGTLQTNTLVDAVPNSTHIFINQTPSVALVNAPCTFADTIVIGANTIGGGTFTTTANGTSGQAFITVDNPTNVKVGQRVIGTNVGPLATVTAIANNNNVIVSKAQTGTVSGTLTFSDEILCTVANIAYVANVSGITAGNTITNVVTNANLYVGATIDNIIGTPQIANSSSNSKIVIAAISGSGPFTLTLRNLENTWRGFTSNGAITFNATAGANASWFEVDRHTAPQTYAWAVAKIKNGPGKLGNTFWHIYVGPGVATFGNSLIIYVKPMTGFSSTNMSAQGVSSLDWYSAAAATSVAGSLMSTIISSSWYAPLTLRTRQSAVDTNFATFSFYEGNNNRNPFFISKYNTATQPWTLDDVFLGGCYEIFTLQAYNTNDAGILFRLRMNGIPKRMAEAGYGNYNLAAAAAYNAVYYRTSSGNRALTTPVANYADLMLYGRQYGDVQTSVTTTYPVYKNVPIYPGFLPVPYYLPEDFALIELPWLNPVVQDTVTVSGSEVYTIIQASTNPVTYTGIVLAARTT